MSDPIEIDGSHGEGGGQILRTAVALAAMTGRSLVITNIRAGRPKPGLAAQHLASVRAAARLCEGGLSGDAAGSTRLELHPRARVEPGSYRFEVGTAGATPLVAQTVAVPLALAGGDSTVTIVGGTHVDHAPTADYLRAVWAEAMASLGLDVDVRNPSSGFNPKGGGELVLRIHEWTHPRAIDWRERGKLTEVVGTGLTTALPEHVAERGLKAMRAGLHGVGRPVKLVKLTPPGAQAGAAVLVSGRSQRGQCGFVGLGHKGKPMEKVAAEAVEAFWAWHKAGAATDEHLADQLVLPLACVPAESHYTTHVPTLHLETVLWVIRHFLPIEASIEPGPGGTATVHLRGVDPGAHQRPF